MNTAVLMFSACLVGADPAVVPACGKAYIDGCAPAVSNTCGGCNTCGNGCGLGILAALKAKLCNPCAKTHCESSCNTCTKAPSCNVCTKAPSCSPCARTSVPHCNPCGHSWGFLSACKAKLLGLCHIGHKCHGGCGTASGCDSAVITPAPAVVPPAKDMPKKEPVKVGYNPLYKQATITAVVAVND